MQKATTSTELQTPAIRQTPDEIAFEGGAGGSYQMVDGQPVLVSRTAAASVSRKAPLTDADGNEVEPAGK
jgi:hypothetical protein